MTDLSSQSSHMTAEPFRVGLIGLNRQGWHLIERCLSGGPFQVTKSIDAEDVNASRQIDELLTSPEIEVAWITHPIALSAHGLPTDLIERLLNHHKHVVVDTLLCLWTAEADRLFAIAKTNGRHLLVHSPRHHDDEIRQACSAVCREELGAVLAAKWVSWGYAISPAGVSRCETPDGRLASSSEQIGGDVRHVDELRVGLIRQLAHALDQLVQLIPHEPLRIFAVGDMLHSDRPYCSPTLAAWIEFKNGAQAEIDIRLNCPAPLHTGWVIHSERGGFAEGRQFSLTDEGEVFDSTVPLIGLEADDLLSLAMALRDQKSVNQTPTQTRAVIQLLEAIRQSAETCSIVNRG